MENKVPIAKPGSRQGFCSVVEDMLQNSAYSAHGRLRSSQHGVFAGDEAREKQLFKIISGGEESGGALANSSYCALGDSRYSAFMLSSMSVIFCSTPTSSWISSMFWRTRDRDFARFSGSFGGGKIFQPQERESNGSECNAIESSSMSANLRRAFGLYSLLLIAAAFYALARLFFAAGNR
jgi:hypothetical protein